MNVLQHTRNERNLFFKPDRPVCSYRRCLLISTLHCVSRFYSSILPPITRLGLGAYLSPDSSIWCWQRALRIWDERGQLWESYENPDMGKSPDLNAVTRRSLYSLFRKVANSSAHDSCRKEKSGSFFFRKNTSGARKQKFNHRNKRI